MWTLFALNEAAFSLSRPSAWRVVSQPGRMRMHWLKGGQLDAGIHLKVCDDAVLGGVGDVGVEQADVGHEGGLRPRLRSTEDLLCVRVGLQQLL
jgi:hypothetical protein